MLLRGLHLLRIHLLQEALRHGPCVLGAIPCDHVGAHAELQGAALRGRQLPQPLDPRADLLRDLAPGQVHIRPARGHGQRGLRVAAEVQRGNDLRLLEGPGVARLVVGAVEVDTALGPDRRDDLHELIGALVALVVIEPVAEALLLGGLPAGDDVEHQPPAGDLLVRHGHLGGQRGGDRSGAEGHQELQLGGGSDQRGRGDPGVLAPRAGGGEHRMEAVGLRRASHLCQVVEARLAGRRHCAVVRVRSVDHGAAVAVGGQEPVQSHAHRAGSLLSSRGMLAVGSNLRPLRRASGKCDSIRRNS